MPAISFLRKSKIFAVKALVLQNTLNLVISHCCLGKNSNDMFKDLQCTCTALDLRCKPFVWRRCHCHRGLLKCPKGTSYLGLLRFLMLLSLVAAAQQQYQCHLVTQFLQNLHWAPLLSAPFIFEGFPLHSLTASYTCLWLLSPCMSLPELSTSSIGRKVTNVIVPSCAFCLVCMAAYSSFVCLYAYIHLIVLFSLLDTHLKYILHHQNSLPRCETEFSLV